MVNICVPHLVCSTFKYARLCFTQPTGNNQTSRTVSIIRTNLSAKGSCERIYECAIFGVEHFTCRLLNILLHVQYLNNSSSYLERFQCSWNCLKNVLLAFSADYPADRNRYQCIYCWSKDNGKNVRLVSCFTQQPATKQFEESSLKSVRQGNQQSLCRTYLSCLNAAWESKNGCNFSYYVTTKKFGQTIRLFLLLAQMTLPFWKSISLLIAKKFGLVHSWAQLSNIIILISAQKKIFS